MSMHDKSKPIQQDVLVVLSAGRCLGRNFYLPAQQLDRKLYERTNEVLASLGGKWNRSAKAHVFAEDCVELIEAAIETGTFTRPGDMGWFPTPKDIAEAVAARADIRPGMFVLEPSAGEGALVLEAVKLGGKVTAIEIDKRRAAKLSNIADVTVVEGDFLAVDRAMQFDRVLMNPPFAQRMDIRHVLHALRFLRDGGKLVAIMSAGVEFRSDTLSVEFRRMCDVIEPLPEGAFKASGTMVRTVVVEITK